MAPSHDEVFGTVQDLLSDALGVDTEPLTTTPSEGDWGGLVFRNDLDNDEVEAGTPPPTPRRAPPHRPPLIGLDADPETDELAEAQADDGRGGKCFWP